MLSTENIPSDASSRGIDLQRLMHTHGEQLRQYIDRQMPVELRRWVEPQDVLQDVFFSAFRHLDSFTPQDSNSAVRWLLTIARNEMAGLMRSQHARKRGNGRIPVDEVRMGSVVLLLQDLAVYERTPSRSAAAHELMSILEESLSKLPPNHRETLRLRYVEGFSAEEVAAKLSRSKGAIRMLSIRGLKQLRREMKSASRFG